MYKRSTRSNEGESHVDLKTAVAGGAIGTITTLLINFIGRKHRERRRHHEHMQRMGGGWQEHRGHEHAWGQHAMHGQHHGWGQQPQQSFAQMNPEAFGPGPQPPQMGPGMPASAPMGAQPDLRSILLGGR